MLSCKTFIRQNIWLFTLVSVLVSFREVEGQSKKRDKKNKGDQNSSYAYQTESTVKRKERKRSQSGKKDKFQLEKPLAPAEFGRNNRMVDYSKPPYFGHRRPAVKRPPGKQKFCKVCRIMH